MTRDPDQPFHDIMKKIHVILTHKFNDAPAIHVAEIGNSIVIANMPIIDAVVLLFNDHNVNDAYQKRITSAKAMIHDVKDIHEGAMKSYHDVLTSLADTINEYRRVKLFNNCRTCNKIDETLDEHGEFTERSLDILESCNYSVTIINVLTWLFEYFVRIYSEPDNLRIDPRLMTLFTDIVSKLSDIGHLVER